MSTRPTITLRYEIHVRERITETTVEAPDNWEAMTDREREDWCLEALDEGISDIVTTGFDWDGMPQ